ncbi:GNAT family N-acetyltransferase [Streptomyces sp. NPDC003401]
MDITDVERVRPVPWAQDDFWLLERNNSPETTGHLGGPESAEQLTARHRRHLELDSGRMYRVVLDGGGETVGSIGYRERLWRGEPVRETGWGVLPEFQGRGLAARAARAVVEVTRRAARDTGGHRTLHAFPGAAHPASDGVCRSAGFTLPGQCLFAYPKGHWNTSDDWCVDLRQ